MNSFQKEKDVIIKNIQQDNFTGKDHIYIDETKLI